MIDTGKLFAIVRRLKGSGLSQAEVDEINAALAGEIVVIGRTGKIISSRGISLMHQFESCRLTAYPDPGSANGEPWTIGWGSTGPGIHKGVVWTQAQCDERFARDLVKFEIGVNTLLAGHPTTQGQFDALVSFAYNVGLDLDEDTKAEGLGDSTLLRKHLAGDYSGAAAEFAKWNKNDGAVMKGLTRRRAAEAALYLS